MASLDDRLAGASAPRPARPGESVPPRRSHRPRRESKFPPQPSVKHHAIRLAVATASGVLVMFILLMLAVKYAQRDWNRKNAEAWASGTKPAPPPAAATTNEPAGWKFELRADAVPRQLTRLSADGIVSDWWVILARSLDKSDPGLAVGALRMAMALRGDSAVLRNDLGAILLQQKRLKDAAAQFRAADQLRPGYAPARFNLALCTISDRNRDQAIVLLGQYLGQRPGDTAALRLLSTLLSQNDRAAEALHLLEKSLKNQPNDQPLFLEAAMLAARLGQNGNALRYLETALNGNPVQAVIRAYQSPAFRDIRLSGEGDALAAVMADRARRTFSTPVPIEELQPLRAPPPGVKVR